MNRNINRNYWILIGICFLSFSCKKFLDKKPDKKLVIPSTVEDAQLLLDNYSNLNCLFSATAETLNDNYYISFTNWQGLSENVRAYHIWDKYDLDGGPWGRYYANIYVTNVVLDNLKSMNSENKSDKWNEVKGSALFYRAYFYYHLAQLFTPPYDKQTANDGKGLPLRLNSDINETSVRSSTTETFNQIISDLTEAASLLPPLPTQKHRPSRAAAYGALARAYLTTQDFLKAGLYADSVLKINSYLMDFDSLDRNSANPLSEFTPETVFHARADAISTLSQRRHLVDSNLIKSYNSQDLRLYIFFRDNGDGTFSNKGMYSGLGRQGFAFAGLATNEMYLTRAESYARSGDVDRAMNDLNTLLEKRWDGTYTPLTASNASEALSIVLNERRKELVYTLTRWSDLRRLNKEPQYQVTLKRVLDGQEYTLLPNSPGYTLQIPKSVIDKSGMIQND